VKGREIISECGINHNGDMETAARMIRFSKECGADVVKFQLFNAEELIDTNPTLPDYNKEWVKKTELSKDDLVFLSQLCRDVYDIEFLSSVFSSALVEWLEDVGVKRYKIPKFLNKDVKLCQATLSTGKEVIVSTGGAQPHCWKHPIDPELLPHPRVRWLYCVSNYPTALEDIKLSRHSFRENEFQVSGYDGFSDHTIGTFASTVAMAFGAKIIEKHFTLDKTMDGPDHKCSADIAELKMLCDNRDKLNILGAGK
jgi:sialic acid synthase SpsE